MKEKYGIIEIGSNNTKTHIYENNKVKCNEQKIDSEDS